jgi:hypothetical protein
MAMRTFTVLFVAAVLLAGSACGPTQPPAPTPTVAATPTVPPSPTLAPRPTLTATAISAPAWADPRRLAIDPARYQGKRIYLMGRVINVQKLQAQQQVEDVYWAQLLADVPLFIDPASSSFATTSIGLVLTNDTGANVLPDKCYFVLGTVTEPQVVTRTLTGTSETMPTVVVGNAKDWPKDQYGACVRPAHEP